MLAQLLDQLRLQVAGLALFQAFQQVIICGLRRFGRTRTILAKLAIPLRKWVRLAPKETEVRKVSKACKALKETKVSKDQRALTVRHSTRISLMLIMQPAVVLVRQTRIKHISVCT